MLFRCWNQTHFICYNLTLLVLYRPKQQSALTARLAASCRWSYGLVDWQRRGRWRSISAKTITSFRYYYLIYVPCCVLCALCSGGGTWTWNLTYSLICSIFLYNKFCFKNSKFLKLTLVLNCYLEMKKRKTAISETMLSVVVILKFGPLGRTRSSRRWC